MPALERHRHHSRPNLPPALLAQHVEMARRIARRVARRVPEHVADELFGAACVGLAEALDRFDPSRGEPFVAFAEKRIRGAVLDELRRGDLLPRRMRRDARRLAEVQAGLEQRLGRPPEAAEVAAALGVSVETYRADLEMLGQVSLVELAEATTATTSDTPDEAALRAELAGRLRGALAALPARDAKVLELHYVHDMTYAEIGRLLGVTESRVCQLHRRALVALRVQLAA
jgi:RNA polymerase sigma factor for flagellar operon FliA